MKPLTVVVKTVTVAMIVYMAAATCLLLVDARYYLAAGLLVGVVSALIPPALERYRNVRVPTYLHLLLTIFLFLSIYVGFVRDVYSSWWRWDDVMHMLSGVAVGVFGVVYVERACRAWAPTLPVGVRILSVVCLAAAAALLWEVFEFSSDQLFGSYFQRDDLPDTMTDMIYGTMCALLVAAVFYSYCRVVARRRS